MGVGGGLGGRDWVPGCRVSVVVLLITSVQYLQSRKVVILLRLLERERENVKGGKAECEGK